MPVKQNNNHRQLILEEYKVLRAESLRCAQTVATTVWVGITGFLVTVGAAVVAARYMRNYEYLLLVTLIFLVLQSLGASTMFLSDFWKYVRIGIYIRTKIEEQFEIAATDREVWRPMNWEHWIQGKRRAGWFPLVSLFVLQLPAFTVLVLALAGILALIPSISHWACSLLLVQGGLALWDPHDFHSDRQ